MRVCRLSVAPLTPLATQQTRRAQTRRVPGITGRSTMHAACDTALRRRATAGACRTFMHFAMQEGGGSQRGWGLSAGDIPFQEDTGHLVRVLRLWPGTAPSCAGRKHWIALHPARTPLLGLHLTISWASSTLSLSLSLLPSFRPSSAYSSAHGTFLFRPSSCRSKNGACESLSREIKIKCHYYVR